MHQFIFRYGKYKTENSLDSQAKGIVNELYYNNGTNGNNLVH